MCKHFLRKEPDMFRNIYQYTPSYLERRHRMRTTVSFGFYMVPTLRHLTPRNYQVHPFQLSPSHKHSNTRGFPGKITELGKRHTDSTED